MTHQHARRVGTGCGHAARTFVCFGCRYTAKVDPIVEAQERRCPTCRKPLVDCGKSFKPPPKQNDRRWKATERAFGWAIKYASENGPTT